MRNSTNTSSVLLDQPLSGALSASPTPTKFLEVRKQWAANSVENDDPASAPAGDSERARNDASGEFRSAMALPSHAFYYEARARRAKVLGDMIVYTYGVVRQFARRAIERNRQRRDAKATYDTLNRLDDRTLRDLGFDRLEISSVAAEASGRVESTRIHLLASLGERP